MNKKFVLTLLSSPALFASMASMMMITPAQAGQVIHTGSLDCIRSPHSSQHKFVCERRHKVSTAPGQALAIAQKQPELVAQAPNQITELAFTDEESDTAIKLFGCDCPACLNSLRQLRSMTEMAV
ncbi:hypothetical protein NIES4071_21560 [Calothrix sp. NIES-4071]|nr:hypothetical protein NIES4071_21560 [Calothrix sp. NIES-4071]BAZ56488.1 hypothetical protein NIES4105_21510 [Calothrix sp. NIES-4105]